MRILKSTSADFFGEAIACTVLKESTKKFQEFD
jgi:hypothetical protein